MNFKKTNRSLRTANATIYFHTHSVSPLFSQRRGKSEKKPNKFNGTPKINRFRFYLSSEIDDYFILFLANKRLFNSSNCDGVKVIKPIYISSCAFFVI